MPKPIELLPYEMINHERPSVAIRVLIFGATGTIGQATVRALIAGGYHVTCVRRAATTTEDLTTTRDEFAQSSSSQWLIGDITEPTSLERDVFAGRRFDIVISCLASRTGAPKDAWRIDYYAHHHILNAAMQAGVRHFILVSAICVQKPLLGFQCAKLAFEDELSQSGIVYSIVRPTAFFKSLSGQIDRILKGKSFLMFGDGQLTRCKPISDDDLGCYLVSCIDDQSKWNCVLPIAGPGDAITPLQQGHYLFSKLGLKPKFKMIPISLITIISNILSFLGRFNSRMYGLAELAKIAHYYATESMLVLNTSTGQYDPDITPSTGSDTLFEYYDGLLGGEFRHQRSDHSIF